MGKDKFSIIIPVYNAELYIDECIKSVIDSTYENWELLLVDDGSNDGSGEICDEWSYKDSRIRVFHQNNRGVSSARNLGIEKAKGNWLVFVDSDDYISSDMMNLISENAYREDADLVFTDYNIIYSDKNELFRTYPWSADKENSFRNYLLNSWPRVAWGAVKKKLIWENGITYPENLTVFEDFHFMCNCILHCNRVIRISEPLYNYRRTNAFSITSTLTETRKKHDELWVYEDLIRIFKSMNKYECYAPAIFWRLLKGKQSWALNFSMQNEFLSFFPEKRKYIMSSPTLDLKMKIIMWCITHHIKWVANSMIIINRIFKRVINV